MRLICPNCDAQYEVDDAAIPAAGRDVQCSNCGHAWFQTPLAGPDPDDEAEEAPAAAGVPPVEAPAAAPTRRALDDNLLAVLREEAAREAAERRAEAARGIETQPDLGPLDAPARAAAAAPQTPAAESAAHDHPITERPQQRRDLLPDIEEINSTLRPGAVARDDEDAPIATPPRERAAFRTGFFSVLLVALVMVILYVMAPQLAERFPGMAGAMTGYVAAVDGLRLWLDGLMQSAAGGLRGLSGEG
jgi:predicted Zn finger-like uncharacterized protein